jgi:hypothetical protein
VRFIFFKAASIRFTALMEQHNQSPLALQHHQGAYGLAWNIWISDPRPRVSDCFRPLVTWTGILSTICSAPIFTDPALTEVERH